MAAVMGLGLVAWSGIAAEPPAWRFEPAGGWYASNVAVTIAGATGEIRYTLDGTIPATNSPLYAGPLMLSNSCYLQARVFATGAPSSAIVGETYTLLETNFTNFTSTLPLVIVQTFGRGVVAIGRQPASLRVVDVATNGTASLLDPPHYEGRAGIKQRGFTSRRYPKISLSVETVEADGSNRDAGLLGLPADSDWVLYAPYVDKSLVRDVLAYDLARQMGGYAARTRFVEVFFNDTTNRLSPAHYAGVYVLAERVKRGAQRVAIHKLGTNDVAEPEITGGYIFKKDHLSEVDNDPAPPAPAPSTGRAGAVGYPTEPGGFPADPAGFLPPFIEVITNEAITGYTNIVPVTNVLAFTNLFPVTNVVITTTISTVTNVLWLTNALPFTNYTTHHQLQFTTNVATLTNVAAVTNVTSVPNVAPFTGVAQFTNVVVFTNVATFTNIATLTNGTAVVTNALLATVIAPFTNLTSITNFAALTNITFATNLVLTYAPGLATNVSFTTNYSYVTNSAASLTAHALAVAASNALAGITPTNWLPASLLRLMSSGQGFITGRTNAFFYVEPKAERITPAQRAWLSNYVSRFEAVLHGPDFRNPTNGYAAFIEPGSFIDQHIIVEATKNIDGFRFSTFYTKDRGGRLRMEPIWDWNLAWGNARGKQGTDPEHWYWPQLDDRQYSWFRRLFEDPDFAQRYVDRWAELRAGVFSNSNLWTRIDAMAVALREPAARNFARWPILDTAVATEPVAGKTFEDQIAYLKTFASNRLAWMDAQFVPLPAWDSAAAQLAAGSPLLLTASVGRVFFTTDGSDPRLTGGVVSTLARPGEAPLVVTNELRVVARVQHGARWSAPLRVTVRPRPPASAAVPGAAVSPVASSHGAADDLFSNNTIRHLRVEISEAGMETLRGYAFNRDQPLTEKPQVLCLVHEGTNTWTNVTAQLKGSASFRSADQKPSLTLNFAKNAPGQSFHGLEKLSLNNSAQDPTRLSERMTREHFARAGVPVPRAGYATLELNGRRLGLYVLLEGWDRTFARRHFRDERGPLYEGKFLSDLDQPGKLSFGEPPTNGLSLPSLVAAAREPDPAKRLERLAGLLDLDRFIRHLAVDMLAWNGDGYALHANNYRIFHDRERERFVFMPHGLDQTFLFTDAPVLAGGDGMLATAALSLPSVRAGVLARMREFRGDFFQPERIRRRAQELTTSLGDVLARETNAPDAMSREAHAQIADAYVARMLARIESLDHQLAAIPNLAEMRVGQAVMLRSWTNRVVAGTPEFLPAYEMPALGLRTSTNGAGAWIARAWLEGGRYRFEGRVRAVPAVGSASNAVTAALRVRSERKRSMGLDWGWDSRRTAEHRPGGETGQIGHCARPATAGTNWTELACEVDLRQPAADLDFWCEASGPGEAFFELASLRVIRLNDPGR